MIGRQWGLKGFQYCTADRGLNLDPVRQVNTIQSRPRTNTGHPRYANDIHPLRVMFESIEIRPFRHSLSRNITRAPESISIFGEGSDEVGGVAAAVLGHFLVR